MTQPTHTSPASRLAAAAGTRWGTRRAAEAGRRRHRLAHQRLEEAEQRVELLVAREAEARRAIDRRDAAGRALLAHPVGELGGDALGVVGVKPGAARRDEARRNAVLDADAEDRPTGRHIFEQL